MNAEQLNQLQGQSYCLKRIMLPSERVGDNLTPLDDLWAEESDRAGEGNYFDKSIPTLRRLDD